jgi:uncharacterized membrane protein YjjP (DUF1212 family)
MTDKDDRNMDDVLDIALDAGRMILQNGGETYRTEETMIAIASSLGAVSASAFVTPTVVMLTCVDPEKRSHTRIQRINSRIINLGKIARVNELSRRLVSRGRTSDLGQVESLLRRIGNAPLHNPVFVVLATAIASFCFSLLFLGNLRDACAAFVIGALLRLVLFLVTPLSLSGFIVSVIGGAVISVLSGLAMISGLVTSSGNISIAVLMSLVPGLAIVNAIRDTIAGDLVAGSARLMEAFVIAAALSLGAAFGLLLFPAESTYSTALLTWNAPVPAFVLSFMATASFSYFFYINKYDILWASLFGAAGWLVYILVGQDMVNPAAGYMTGALCVGVLSEVFAIILKKPATVFIVPGIIPLVPGGGMYETMLLALMGKMDAAAATGFTTLSAAAAIAAGIALASSVARLFTRKRISASLLRAGRTY